MWFLQIIMRASFCVPRGMNGILASYERDLWVKLLLCTHKDLSLNPQKPWESLRVIIYTGMGCV